MNRRQTAALVVIAAAGAFAAGRATIPAPAHAAMSAAMAGTAPGTAAQRTTVSFQFVPAGGPRQSDLLIRGWDTGDIDYIDVSRLPRDEDPVRYLWTESGWRFVSQYPPPRR